MENQINLIDTREKIISRIMIFILLSGIILSIIFVIAILSPKNFPSQKIVEIKYGTGLVQLSKDLKKQKIIKSSVIFELLVIISTKNNTILAGNYYFEKPMGTIEITRRLINGKFNLAPIKITIPEGYTIKDINELLSKKLIKFDSENFLNLAKGKEGFLFPDTYLFFPTASANVAYKELNNNFNKKVEKLNLTLLSDNELNKIVTMASLIEKEAGNNEEMPFISGILSNRLKKNMPLQVDASFIYLLGKKSSDLTKDDLKIDSPYNTYVNKGLPPGPINNPGMNAILASLNPAKTPYYFYLHDKDGIIHYAKTFEEHKINKRKYLNN